MRHTQPRTTLNVAQHTSMNFLKMSQKLCADLFLFSSSAVTNVIVFSVRPKTVLLMWPTEAERVDTPNLNPNTIWVVFPGPHKGLCGPSFVLLPVGDPEGFSLHHSLPYPQPPSQGRPSILSLLLLTRDGFKRHFFFEASSEIPWPTDLLILFSCYFLIL